MSQDQLMFWSEEHLARAIQLPDFAKVLKTRAAASCSSMELLRIITSLPGSSGKTYPEFYPAGGGADFKTFLDMLGELGYGYSYRVLDAQYFGVAQRRRRVFVVGYLGDWRRAAAVLFESESMFGNPPPSREPGKGVAGTISARTSGGGGLGTDFELGGGLQVAHTLRGEGFDASEDGTGRGTPIVPVAIQAGALRENPKSGPDGIGCQEHIAYTIEARAEVQAVCYDMRGREGGAQLEGPHDTANIRASSGGSSRSYVMATGQGNAEITEDHAPTLNCNHEAPIIAFDSKRNGVSAVNLAPTLRSVNHAESHANAGGQIGVMTASTVRRLTPRECERLQGFPDDWTRIPWRGACAEDCPDGPRYKAVGNSMAVPVMNWIGKRIELVEKEFES